MSECFYVDVSEYQPPADDSYRRDMFMFRLASEYGRLDNCVVQNLRWARVARASGKLAQFGGYIIPLVVDDATILSTLDAVGFPTDAVVMLDMESWAGRVSGDHSDRLNAMVKTLAERQGDLRLVWGYGNQYDLATIWPRRPAGLGLIVAGYGGSRPDLPGMIGWQYTDGVYGAPAGYPTSSAPFGPCDHNVLFIEPPAKEDEMPLTDADADKVVDRLMARMMDDFGFHAPFGLVAGNTLKNADTAAKPTTVWGKPISRAGVGPASAETWLADARNLAAAAYQMAAGVSRQLLAVSKQLDEVAQRPQLQLDEPTLQAIRQAAAGGIDGATLKAAS